MCQTYSAADLDKMAEDALKSSFKEKGIAKTDRLNQDAVNKACSAAEMVGKDLDPAVRKSIEEANMKTVKFPSDGKFLGDWKQGEKEARVAVA